MPIQAKISVSMSLSIPRTCLKVGILALFLLFWLQNLSQPKKKEPPMQAAFGEVDQILEKNLKTLGNNVVAVIYKDSQIVYQKEIGEYFNIKSQAPIASCSKWLTAALVMTFVDQGKLDLDDPVSKYLPIFDKYMKSYVTIRHCLAHTTGIENDKGKFLQRKKFASLEEEVNSYAAKEISNNAGTEFHYGNIGPTIAARVCEVIGKKAFERLVQERITRPLKMRATTFTNDDGSAPNPSGGAKSTAGDYINFLVMILNKGMFEGKRVLSEEAVAEMQKPQGNGVPIKYIPKVAEGYEYGLGEWIQEKDAKGIATVVSSPGLFGTWPYIDKCRNYVAIIFVKSLINEQKKEIYTSIKEAIDAQLPARCN